MTDLLDATKPTDIVAVVNANPVMVLTDEAKFDEFYEGIRRETSAHVADVSTEKGRKKIASLAYKVARTKTAIDDAGKKLNEDARKQIDAVDKSRKAIREKLDALREEVRQPLTEWEKAEDDRKEMVTGKIEEIKALAVLWAGETSVDIHERLDQVNSYEIDEALFKDSIHTANLYRENAVTSLNQALEIALKSEADQAELERLRMEAEERDRAEQQRLADEQAERDRKAEEERQAAEAAAEEERAARADQEAKEREDRLKQEAAQAAADEAAKKARQEADQREQEHQAQLQAERDKAAALEAERQREEDERIRIADEAAKRAADQNHRAAIKTAVKEALMTHGNIDESSAKLIVLAIMAGDIPHTSINF